MPVPNLAAQSPPPPKTLITPALVRNFVLGCLIVIALIILAVGGLCVLYPRPRRLTPPSPSAARPS